MFHVTVRRLLLALACASLAVPAVAGAQSAPDYVDLEGRKRLPLRLASPDAVAGSALATGDFNGDGADDLAVGAYGATPMGREEAGGVEVLFGPIVARKPKARLVVLGAAPLDRTGIALANLGDIDDDGADELGIGAYQASPLGRPGAGMVYVLEPNRAGTIDLADPAFEGRRILGARPADNLGRSLAGVGDQDADGLPDLLLGAPGADPGNRVRAGAAYVVKSDLTPGGVLDLAVAPGTQAFRFAGPGEGAVAGWAVAGGDDRDGDDQPDFAIAAPEDVNRAGRVFLVSGGWRTEGVDLGGRPPGVDRIVGPRGGQLLGFSLAEVGDFSGDGLSDYAVGSWGSSPRKRRQAGQVYVLTRNASLMRPTVMGAGDGDRLGRAVAGGRDLSGDGRPDLVLGASAAQIGDADYSGAAAIVPAGTGRIIDLEEDFDKRVLLAGAPRQSRLGDAVAGDADLDGDGRADVVLGIPGAGGVQRRGAVLLVPNPYPVRVRITRAGRTWCRAGRLVATVSVNGSAFLRASLSGGGRSRSLTRRVGEGEAEVALRWAGRRARTARLRIRATGRDGRRVERSVRVPAGC